MFDRHRGPRILVAEHAGVCYGVERALQLTYDAARDARQPVRTLGPLIHNPRVVVELAAEGVGTADAIEQADGGTIVIRAHGVVPQAIEAARARGLDVIDATCPYVKKVHHAASKLAREGYQVIVVGESGHPEVEGILGHAGEGVVVQTTQTDEKLGQIVAALVSRVGDVKVINTICKATHERQESAAALASRVDAMIVIGGKNSGNTRRLAQICSERCENTHHIEDAAELDAGWFGHVETIGVTAGASTPPAHIRQAIEALLSINPGSSVEWDRDRA